MHKCYSQVQMLAEIKTRLWPLQIISIECNVYTFKIKLYIKKVLEARFPNNE